MREAVSAFSWAALSLVAAAGISCGGGGAVTMGTGGSSQTSSTEGDAGTGTGGSSEGGKGGTGTGTAVVGDAIPITAVSYFQGTTCPKGWAAHDTVAGRVAVPTVGAALGGATAGTPLASGEDRTHTHSHGASFTLPAFSYAGIAGEANHGVAAAGTVTASAPVDAASTGLPYVQLLVCKKHVDETPGAAPLPSGMLMFFEAVACPAGWKQAATTQGRLLVGLPEGGSADAPFGGGPLDPEAPPTHRHATSVTLDTDAHGIALASGCCASGYGVDGVYPSTQDTGATDPALPIVTLLQCQKL